MPVTQRERSFPPLFFCPTVIVVAALTALAVVAISSRPIVAADRPNILFVLCDDLGYGDVGCFNPRGKIATPCLDRLAREGCRFTDAHSGSAVCTPTRYGLLTGRYAWRSRLQRGVLGGLSPRLIEPGRLTVAQLLKDHGYQTFCVGKWHLGLDWVVREGESISPLSIETPDQVESVDYAQPFANGPLALGFDQFFGIAGSLDMVPYTFLRNDRVAAVPTDVGQFEMFPGANDGFTRSGPLAPGFAAEQVLPELIRESISLLERAASRETENRPFFLYLPLASPHTPVVPTRAWRGKSGLNYYADFVMETDHGIGQIFEALTRLDLARSTLVIVTSDNGCSPMARLEELAAKGHDPSGGFRGAKADIYEGGHRVPFIVRWPGRIPAGSVSSQLICHTDLMATCAEILGIKMPVTAGEDSESWVAAARGEGDSLGRESIVHHSIDGSFALRRGRWKLALCPGSGGWSAPRPGRDPTADLPPVQLFDLVEDPGESLNRAGQHPEIVERLRNELQSQITRGRSAP